MSFKKNLIPKSQKKIFISTRYPYENRNIFGPKNEFAILSETSDIRLQIFKLRITANSIYKVQMK